MAREAMNYNDLEHMLHQDAEPRMINFLLLKEITNNFSEERKIGSGGFGDVYMGVLPSHSIVAVKRLSKLISDDDKPFQNEVECLMTVKHRNIARFLGYCALQKGEMLPYNGRLVLANQKEMLLCFEYLSNGNIRNQLKEKPHRDNWPARYKMIRGICQGLHYLHDKQIIHRDLKPENVMLDAQMEPKITDFGLSRFLEEGTSTLVTQQAGTFGYIAPETIDKGEVSLKSDIYALGVTMVELLSGISKISLLNWTEYIDAGCPRATGCTKIAQNCMDRDKHKRPTMREVIRDLDNLESTFPWSSITQKPQSRPTRPESTVVKLPARSLTIAWVDNPEYWRWIPDPDARFTRPSLK
ncbi:unnamed protein product [Triticum turgidum subsp. durum]|uniref:non-specific serine/threonine protein kinase n=1 Tax=Triticum turgidum subsp. durum TaxID=4567 RepID=A0A9R0YXS8_TRITD|nr:unnamed protein product [Triticum turgidum subsp. durum]